MKKFDFSKKHNISVICFLLILIITCILCFNVPIVHAEESDSSVVPISSILPSVKDNIITAAGYEDSPVYDSSALYNEVLASDEDGYGISPEFYDGDPTNGEAYIDNSPIEIRIPDRNSSGADIENTFEFGLSSNLVYFSKTSAGTYSITCINSIYTMPSPKFLVLGSGANVISTDDSYLEYLNGYQNFSSTSYACFVQYTGQLDLSGDYPKIVFTPSQNKGIYSSTEAFYSGENNGYGEPIYKYFGAQGIGYSNNVFYCTKGIYTVTDGSNVNTVLAVNGVDSSGQDIGSATLINVNYGSSGEESTVYPDGSGGDVTNNMYLETADWKFNIPKYWGNVTSTLVQPKYTSNWGSGNISFTAICNDFIQDNSSDYKLVFNFYTKIKGHRFSDTHSEIDENFAKSFAWRSVEYNLSDYLNNKAINVDFTVDNIFTSSFDQGMNTNVKNYLETIKTYNSIDNWDWSISCDAQLVSGSYTSGSIQENYNFISQVSKELSNTITENNNPFYPEDEDGKPIIPDDDSNNNDTSKKDGIVIYNNPTFNNNVNASASADGGGMGSGIVPNILGTLANNQSSSVDTLESISGVNGWMSVINQTYSFVPDTIWTAITVSFVACLGILVIGFVISLIIKLIT